MPLDPKSAASVDVDTRVELALLRNHVPVAANAIEVASGECDKKAHREKIRLHKIVFSSWTPVSSFLDSKILPRPRPWLRGSYRQINRVGKFIVDIKLDSILSSRPAVGRAGKSELTKGVADGSNG